ncbi:DoxX family protein [Pedobacter aquatilis]|uniref:DoxX family protein n=1 Tax=Pedobacter aquatilis TaxID=351343 RepID=UPI002931424A|nr:DoxX family protein [Pedobacter aquatilis]
MDKIINWLLISLTVIILMYNAYVKLSWSPGAVQLFSSLNLEPYGRVIVGTLEVLAALLLLYPPIMKYGALLATCMMLGVIITHLTKIGIALSGDYSFFSMGLIAFVCSAVLSLISFKNR